MSLKQLYGVLFIVVWGIVFFSFMKVRKKDDKIAATFKHALLWSLIAIFSYIIMLFSNTYRVNSFCYSIFFVCMDWLLYSLLKFAWCYTSIELIKQRVPRRICMGILILDSVSMILNTFFEHALGFHETYYKGELYLIFIQKPLYHVHLGICYLMCIILFYTLIRETICSPSLYKRKYFMPCFILMLVVGINGIFLFFHLRVDISILFYSFAGIIMYTNVFTFQPRYLLMKTMTSAMEEVNDVFLIYDVNNTCMWQNNKSKELFGVVSSVDALCDKIHLSCQNLQEQTIKKRISIIINGIQKYFDMQYHEIIDDKYRYMGCFFLFHDVSVEVEHYLKQEYLAHYDQFTGLYNRYYFYEQVEKELIAHPEEDYLIMVSDIGRFKFVNDTFGTSTGNEIIQRIASKIRETAPQDAIYARFESDKFSIFMKKKYFNPSTFIKSSKEILMFNETLLPVNQYLGIYEVTDRSLSVEIMCDRAIMALNTIKGNFQTYIAYYDLNYYIAVKHEQEIIGDFHEAIKEEQFQLYLQPQMNHETQEIAGAEALVRWLHPIKGTISPADFIPVLEKNGMIAKLDVYVWDKACQLLKKWKEEGHSDRSISVNISPKDLYFVDIYATFTQLVEKYQISPASLKLEITESSVMTEVKKQIEMIEKLQSLGFIVEMDDFGSGYSSLNTLKDIPVDILKMDMKFFARTNHHDRSTDILKTVIELAQRLRVPVIAEGVEHKEQADYLSSIGCCVVQGYLYAKPMPVTEFEQFISKYKFCDILDAKRAHIS